MNSNINTLNSSELIDMLQFFRAVEMDSNDIQINCIINEKYLIEFGKKLMALNIIATTACGTVFFTEKAKQTINNILDESIADMYYSGFTKSIL